MCKIAQGEAAEVIISLMIDARYFVQVCGLLILHYSSTTIHYNSSVLLIVKINQRQATGLQFSL